MEYFNLYNQVYIDLCKAPVITKLTRLCILDHTEHTLFEFTGDVSTTEGSVNVNYQQGVRRTCSLKISNIDTTCLPIEQSPFWVGRKFKLYMGLLAPNGDIYWYSQGVYYCKNPVITYDSIGIDGVDKFAQFTEDLNMNIAQGTYKLPAGEPIRSAVLDLLATDMGNGNVLDPIDPRFDNEFYDEFVPFDIVVDEGGQLGSLLEDVAKSLGADVYYDIEGHLCFTKNQSEDYSIYPIMWRFEAHCPELNPTNIAVDYAKLTNAVTVFGYDGDGALHRQTVENDYAASPIRVSAIGRKAGEPIESPSCYDYLHCRRYAEYELRRCAMIALSVECQCATFPHFDVDKAVYTALPQYQLEDSLMIIQSLTLDLGTGESSLTMCNSSFLQDMYETSTYSILSDLYRTVGVTDFIFELISDTEVQLLRYIGKVKYVNIPPTLAIDGVEYTVTTLESTCFNGTDIKGVRLPATLVRIS